MRWLLVCCLVASQVVGVEAEPRLHVDAAGAWKSAGKTVSGYRVFAVHSGGRLNARGLGCDGFTAATPALTLSVDPGVAAVDVVAYADKPVRVIAYRSRADVACGELADLSEVRLAGGGGRYRVHLASADRGVLHFVLLAVAPASQPSLPPLGRRRARAARYALAGARARGRGKRFAGELAISDSADTVAAADFPISVPAPGTIPLRIEGRCSLGDGDDAVACRGSHRQLIRVSRGGELRVQVDGWGWKPVLHWRLREARDRATPCPKVSERPYHTDQMLGVEPGVYELCLAPGTAVVQGEVEYRIQIQVCDAKHPSACAHPLSVGGAPAAQLSTLAVGGSAAAVGPPALSAVRRLRTASGLCTATVTRWRGRPALLTAAHCLYAAGRDGALGPRLRRATLEPAEALDLHGARVASSFRRCVRQHRTYDACLRGGAEDLALIPLPAGRRVAWRLCSRPPRGDEVYSLGYGLTETGLPDQLIAARLALSRRGAAIRGAWRARRPGVAVQPGDSGGPAVSIVPSGRATPAVCFVVSGLDSRSASPVSLLQPTWDLDDRLDR